MRRGADERAQLRTEDIGALEAEPHGTVPHERIGFVGKVAEALIAAEIQGAERHRPALRRLHDLGIFIILDLLVGPAVEAQVEVLRSVKTDAAGAVGQGVFHLSGIADVGLQAEGRTIGRQVRQGNLRKHPVAARPDREFLVAIPFDRLSRGIDDDQARFAVDEEHVAFLHGLHEPLDADDRRDVERAGHDRGVAGAAALFRDKGEHAAVMQAGGVGRSQVARGDDMGLGGLPDAFGLGAEQLIEHAARHVPDVRRPLAQEVVVHLLEDLDVALGDFLEAELDVEAAAADFLADVIDERDVFEDEQVRVEDRGLGFVELAGDVVAQLGDLLTGRQQGGLQATDLGFGVGDLLAGDDGHAAHERVGGTTGDAGGGGDAPEAYLGPMVSSLHPGVH